MSQSSDVLVVIAHPDDEVFVSGTICLCADRGFRITLVSATNGEGGSREVSGEDADLGEIRRQELSLSARVLGIAEVLFLNLGDIAAPEKAGPGSWNQPEVISALGRIIAQRMPRIILTHGPLGGYGNAAHKLVYHCVRAAAEEISFAGSIFSFCGRVKGSFFSWHLDQPSDVLVDARAFLRRRAAGLSYHQSQMHFFVQPLFPRNLRKVLSAAFGFCFAWTEAGRKRVPIVTANRFFRRFPMEGLALQYPRPDGMPHFFKERFGNDPRVTLNG